MAFYLERGEPAGPGMRRLVHEQVDEAVRALTDPEGDVGAAIHCTRKQIKKLRAILRLVRDGIGEARYRRENRTLRDLAGSLGAARDADVRVQTFEKLTKRLKPRRRTLRAIHDQLLEQREAARPDPAGGTGQRRHLQRVVRGLRAFRGRVDRWPVDAISIEVLLRGLKRSYRRGRSAMTQALEADGADAERFHDWRKRVKDLWYHTRILGGAWSRRNGERIEDLSKLGDLLGEDHDLAVLATLVGGLKGSSQAAVTQVVEAAHARRTRLQRKARSIGKRVYAEKPRAFLTRMAKPWNGEKKKIARNP